IRSYIPFVIFVVVCLSIIGGLLWLVVSIAQDLTGSSPTASRSTVTHQTHSQHTPASATPSGSITQHGAHTGEGTGAPVFTMTPVGSLLGVPGGNAMEISPGGPLPTKTPAPTATATGDSGLVVAREVDLTGKALEASTRFVSPSLRFYAVVTVHNVRSSDQLHFVFQRNGAVLPSDDIQYQAGTDADVQSFSAWADYKGGTTAFPKGQYRVLFYRNGVLEAVCKFSVG
ncbi:MAG: hypothetical protein ACRDG4_19555, partial [Chloroflexota bacterium]